MKIDGREIAKKIIDSLEKETATLQTKGIIPTLAVIVLGNNPTSLAYIKQKQLKSEEIGTKCIVHSLNPETSEKELQNLIEKHNNDKNIHGIIVQRPLPPHLESQKVGEWVIPQKDIDGFNSQTKFIPPISLAILEILKSINISLQRKKVVVIGRGETGGKPIANTMIQKGAIVTIAHSKTPDISFFTKRADIVISCVGKPNIVRRDMLNKDTTLIGVGMYKGEDGKLHADYEEEEIEGIVKYYTPVPGGVGPVNVACLLKNLIEAVRT